MVVYGKVMIDTYLRNFVLKKVMDKLEKENKELKAELSRKIKNKDAIDVEYKIIE
jgi:hypothetical protein